MKHEHFCQSCSMPLCEDLLGTEADGSKNCDYCKFCYQNGNFSHADFSLEQMIAHLQTRMDRDDLPEDIIESAIARLPHLKRWQTTIQDKK